MRGRRSPGGAARGKRRVVHEKVETARRDVKADAVSALDQRERAADRRFGRDMEHDGAEGGAAHARVGDAQHVLDAAAGEFARNGDISRFRHSRRSLRAGVAQHKHVVVGDLEIGRVDALSHVLQAVEHDGPALMRQQFRRCRGLLHDGAVGGQIAAQHDEAALGVKGVAARAHDALRPRGRGGGKFLAQRAAGYRQAVEIEQRDEFAQDRREPPALCRSSI